MNNEFAKSDLETGMRVKTAMGELYLVVKNYQSTSHGLQDVMFFDFNGGFNSSGVYENNLTCGGAPEYDIVSVYSKPSDGDFLNEKALGKILWERQRPLEMTISEIEEKLGIKNLKIVAK